MNSKMVLVLVTVAVGGLVGCTLPSSRRTVSRAQANVMQNVLLGSVTRVQEVTIEGQRSNLGLYGGGLVGGAAGSGGSGVGGAVVQATSAVVGAVAGQAIEEAATRKRAQQITVQLDNGQIVSITQEHQGGLFRDGDRVRVLDGSAGTAVVVMDTGS